MEYSSLKKPSKSEQSIALKAYQNFVKAVDSLQTDSPEIVIKETQETIQIPLQVLKLMKTILKATSQGKPISIVPIATEMTTQAAAELLGCSRPHIVKLLEGGKIPFTKVGRHRRLKFEDVLKFKEQMKSEQEQLLIEIMNSDEDLGLYDS